MRALTLLNERERPTNRAFSRYATMRASGKNCATRHRCSADLSSVALFRASIDIINQLDVTCVPAADGQAGLSC